MKFLSTHKNGFRIWRLEFYKIEFYNGTKPVFCFTRAFCGCFILDLWKYGVSWLNGDCYKYAEEMEKDD